MTKEELLKYDGVAGNPAYVAVSGVIYDVSSSKLWSEGNHEGSHQAGQDLTEELKSAPHVRSVLERFPVVGQLEVSPPQQKASGKLPIIPLVIAAVVVIALLTLLLR